MTTYLGDVSELDLASYIRPGDTVAWGQACAEPLTLTEALAEQRRRLGGIRCFTGISSSAAVRRENCDHLSFASYTAAGANRALAKAGALDILAAHYSELPRQHVDVIFLSLPPPRPDGTFGLGLGADYVAALVGHARIVIAEVNDQVPDLRCAPGLAPDQLDVIVAVSRPPAEYPAAAPRAIEDSIAALHRRPRPRRRDDPAGDRQHAVGRGPAPARPP